MREVLADLFCQAARQLNFPTTDNSIRHEPFARDRISLPRLGDTALPSRFFSTEKRKGPNLGNDIPSVTVSVAQNGNIYCPSPQVEKSVGGGWTQPKFGGRKLIHRGCLLLSLSLSGAEFQSLAMSRPG